MNKLKIASIILGALAIATVGVCIYIYCDKKSELEDAREELQEANDKKKELYEMYKEIDNARSY